MVNEETDRSVRSLLKWPSCGCTGHSEYVVVNDRIILYVNHWINACCVYIYNYIIYKCCTMFQQIGIGTNCTDLELTYFFLVLVAREGYIWTQMVNINSRERLCPDRLADSMHARSCWRSNTCIGRVGCRLLLEFQVGATPMFQHVRALDSWNPKVMYGMSNGECVGVSWLQA